VARVFEAATAGTVLARLPLLPADPAEGSGRAAGPLLAEAVAVASHQAALHAAQAGSGPASGRWPEVLRAYELRARFRPTPHGAFAAVTTARFSGGPYHLHLAGELRARSYLAGAWLDALCGRLLEDDAVVSAVTFTTSNLVTRRGRRFETQQPAEAGARHVSVRASEAVVILLARAADAATAGQLTTAIHQRWPQIPATVIHTCLRDLARDGFLLTSLLPEDVTGDPLAHLLREAPAAAFPPLTRLWSLLTEADQYQPGAPARLTALQRARETATMIADVDRPLMTDVTATAHLDLPAALADQAVQAAGMLWRIGLTQPPLAGYHERFVARYGTGRLVPLLEAADPVTGLGLAGIEDQSSPPEPPGRAETLAGLIADAIAGQHTEAVLDTAVIAALSHDDPGPPPPTAELIVRVFAASKDDLAARRLRIAITGGSPAAGSTQGRFRGLLALPDITCTAEPAVTAEIVTRPARTPGTPLAPPAGHARRIPVGFPPRNGDLLLETLSLSSNGRHLVLWSSEESRPIMPVACNRLAPHMLPPIARFLQLTGLAGCYPLSLWSWGTAAAGPFQPRVTYRSVILAPARWLLPAHVRAAAGRKPDWERTLAGWRQHAVVPLPDVVLTHDHDRTLPLDLRRPDDRELLRRYVHRGVRAVTEPPGGPDAIQGVAEGPHGRHALELVIPLRRTVAARPASRPPVPRPPGSGLHLPGGAWLSLAIPCPAQQQNDLLTGIAALTADMAGLADCWFWLRYNTTALGQHLRIRFHGDPAVLGGQVLPAVSAWCAGAIRAGQAGGITVEAYEQETERYGGPAAVTAAERVFAADSSLVLWVIAATSDPARYLIAAATAAAAIARTVAGGDMAALDGRRLDRAAHQRMAAARQDVRAIAEGVVPYADPALTAAWLESLAAYRAAVPPPYRARCASSLIHMHQNRLLGDNTIEPLIRARGAGHGRATPGPGRHQRAVPGRPGRHRAPARPALRCRSRLRAGR
jgi:thiopeptide-type bacteriocin biosynthesis protein